MFSCRHSLSTCHWKKFHELWSTYALWNVNCLLESYTVNHAYSIVQKQCKWISTTFVLCSREFLSEIAREISLNFVQKVLLSNNISSDISRKNRTILRKDKQKIASSKIHRSVNSRGNWQINVKWNKTTCGKVTKSLHGVTHTCKQTKVYSVQTV